MELGGLPPLTVRPRRLSDEETTAHPHGGAAAHRHDADTLVAHTNRLLAYAGLAASARTAEHAVAVCAGTSLFVAAVECAVGHRLEGALRVCCVGPHAEALRVRCVYAPARVSCAAERE